jgi:hypothetical protein
MATKAPFVGDYRVDAFLFGDALVALPAELGASVLYGI